jgi:transcriptional regulator with XRE-family HTH domain
MNTEARAADFDTGALLTPRVLRDKRKLLRLTQAEIARQLGVAANTVARWERGEMRPSHPEVMARRLGRLQRAAKIGLVERPTDEKLTWAPTPKRHPRQPSR